MPNLREAIEQASKKLAADLETAAREWVMDKVLGASSAPAKKPVVRKEKKKKPAIISTQPVVSAKKPAYVIPAMDGSGNFYLLDDNGALISVRKRARDLSTVAKRKGYEIQKNEELP